MTAAEDALGRIAATAPVRLKGVGAPEGADGARASGPVEPVFDEARRRDVQGNIVPGFNKDHQHFLFLRIRRPDQARRWVARIAPSITSMDEALTFVREHRARRHTEGVREPEGLRATWVNIAFSHAGIAKLAGAAEAARFGEQSFRDGLAARSTHLGDPTSPEHPGHRDHWLVGGPGNEADVLVIVAADDAADLAAKVEEITAGSGLLDLVFEQEAHTLPGNLAGHEHFGFKDGVSQPGVRGRLSATEDDFLTTRHLVTDDPLDRRPELFGKPGQLLVWPGQFLLGEPRQDPQDLIEPEPERPERPFPGWAALGSYLVCRRLRQDVPAFWAFATAAAERVGIDPVRFASMLVGRWPSGAPIMRAVDADDAALAGDEYANNHFIFDDDTREVRLRPMKGYGGDLFPQARADMLGTVCPHFAHIRKTNPRDSATDLGKPHDSMLRMILRRGIPYGPPAAGASAATPDPDGVDRGLVFVGYGATIEDQFEFLTRRWANSPNQPNDGGHDPVIGQRDARGDRERFVDVAFEGRPSVRVPLGRDWVVPTGGGYFFAPPISALTTVLGEP